MVLVQVSCRKTIPVKLKQFTSTHNKLSRSQVKMITVWFNFTSLNDRQLTLSSKSKKISMSTLGRLGWKVFVIEVQHEFLSLETKLLVEQHCRIASRHVQSHVLSHARLKPGTNAQQINVGQHCNFLHRV